ncbi:MAG: 5'-nucleotidase C-terminal domain-containing protein [Polyangiaceae bacterium]
MRPHSFPRCKRRSLFAWSACLLLSSCTSPAGSDPPPRSAAPTSSAAAPGPILVSVVGLADLHGHVETTPLLGGYVANLRAARAATGGGVLLVDAGDMFQGTLESNLGEGRAVLHAYGALGVAAAAVGNHEFDYGPAGPAATPTSPSDDPRGALLARIREAPFPILSANVAIAKTHARLPIGEPSTIVQIAGVSFGIIGVTSADTLQTTAHPNVADLEIKPLASTIEAEAKRLRTEARADVVVVLAHAGAKCRGFRKGIDEDQCEKDAEIFKVARELPKGAVDVIVAGHTHQGVAETVNGVPIVQAWAYGRAFSRVDLSIERGPSGAKVAGSTVFEPQALCPDAKEFSVTCARPAYEGSVPQPDAAVAAAIAPDVAAAKVRRDENLGVVLKGKVRRDYDHESEEGNLFVDLLREAYPTATVAMTNGGGLREDLPAGPLRYGSLFEAFPFDNKVGFATLRGADLVKLLTEHMRQKGGVLSVSGIRVRAACRGADLKVEVTYDDGKPVGDADTITLLASDFMLTGGDSFWGSVHPSAPTLEDALVRDVLEAGLKKRSEIDPSALVDEKNPRMSFPGTRPVRCP